MATTEALTKVMDCAYAAKSELQRRAANAGKPVQIVLHWTAGRYESTCGDYHINIIGNGDIVIREHDFAQKLAHNYRKNEAAIGLTLCCAYNANTNRSGDYPPTSAQIETMAQVIAVITKALDIPIDKIHVPTHGESADNEDYVVYYPEYSGYPNNTYGPKSDCERWDLDVLYTAESPHFDPYNEITRGGSVLRGKALWYRNQYYGYGN